MARLTVCGLLLSLVSLTLLNGASCSWFSRNKDGGNANKLAVIVLATSAHSKPDVLVRLNISLSLSLKHLASNTPSVFYVFVHPEAVPVVEAGIQDKLGPTVQVVPIAREAWALPKLAADNSTWGVRTWGRDYVTMGDWRLVAAPRFARDQGHRYLLFMDDDSFILEQIPEDLVRLFDKKKYKWGARMFYPDVSMVTWGLPELTRYFLTTHRISPTTLWEHCDPPGWSGLFSSADNASEAELQLEGSWRDAVTPRAGGWDRQVIEGNFMLISLEMYFRPLFQRFVELCRASGGTGQYRWNEQSVLAMAVQLFVEKDELYVGTFQYNHTKDISKAMQFWAGLPDSPWSPYAALSRVGHQIQELTRNQPVTWLGAASQPCEIEHIGSGWGEHRLCRRSPARPCVFYSFGISSDYSFDTQLAQQSGCKGYCFDPTISHNSQLGDNLLFFKTAASSLDDELNRHWDAWTSVPRFKQWQGHAGIAVLKMDCEGCEFAIARDVEQEEPDFWQQVDQFAVEIHVPKKFMPTDEHVQELGHLFSQLERAGLVLRDAMMTPCSPKDEGSGCHPLLLKAGYPCDKGQMCQNLLFAR